MAALLSGGIDPCLTRVCTLRSWPDRPRAYAGTPFVGDAGPEAGIGKLPAFFVHRPPIGKVQVERCDLIEVMHVKTDCTPGLRRGTGHARAHTMLRTRSALAQPVAR